MRSERAVKNAIKNRLRRLSPRSWDYMPPGGPYGKAGVPDHLFCVPVEIKPEHVGSTFGVMVAIEAKAQTGKLRPTQKVQLTQIRDAGGIAVVVRPSNIDDVFEALHKRINGNKKC